MKKLHKSKDKVFCGVCGGIAEYCNVDPNIIRLLCILFTLCAGGGLILYIAGIILIPDN